MKGGIQKSASVVAVAILLGTTACKMKEEQAKVDMTKICSAEEAKVQKQLDSISKVADEFDELYGFNTTQDMPSGTLIDLLDRSSALLERLTEGKGDLIESYEEYVEACTDETREEFFYTNRVEPVFKKLRLAVD